MKSPQEVGAIRSSFDGPAETHHSGTESPRQYQVICSSFRGFEKNTLRGFLTLTIDPPGISIRDYTLHEKDGKRWVNPPSRQYTDGDGAIHWQPLISIEDKVAYWRFRDLAIEAIDAFHASAPSDRGR